ncbi:phospholipid scramblase 2-like [Glossophaga mutica]
MSKRKKRPQRKTRLTRVHMFTCTQNTVTSQLWKQQGSQGWRSSQSKRSSHRPGTNNHQEAATSGSVTFPVPAVATPQFPASLSAEPTSLDSLQRVKTKAVVSRQLSHPQADMHGPRQDRGCPEAQRLPLRSGCGIAQTRGEPQGYRVHPGPQDAYPGPQVNSSVPTPGCSSAALADFPVQHQPGYNQAGEPAGPLWMPAPPPLLDCPPGLEYLTEIDKIQIHQQIDLLEVTINIEANNKYEIKNSLGQRIYFAVEDTDCCTRNYCSCYRPSTMRILDFMSREVITLERPLRCTNCFCLCCLPEIKIYSPPGTLIGYVIQARNPYLPKVTIQNEDKKDILRIIGPCCARRCFEDVVFEIKSIDEENVIGTISKQWTGFVREAFTDCTNFDIHFPLDLDVKMKAVMIGACLFIECELQKSMHPIKPPDGTGN